MTERDYRINGKPIREMTNDELRAHLEKLTAARSVVPEKPRAVRGARKATAPVDRLADAEEI